mmetsp:Transcript_66003/g.162474  ORF Transcript_66003/g.162474 Transcript_66003/m.162474 type:complete len:371 (-) Transcript_66003:2-1114(-)
MASEARMPAMVHSLALPALQAYFSSVRRMGSHILEARICSLDPGEEGVSYVVARFVLPSGVTVEIMRLIRTSVLTELMGVPDLIDRLEVEAADGEHFNLLWMEAGQPQTFFEIWKINDREMKELEAKFIAEIPARGGAPSKSKSTWAKIELKQKYFKQYVQGLGASMGFSLTSLPHFPTEVDEVVGRMSLGSPEVGLSIPPRGAVVSSVGAWEKYDARRKEFGIPAQQASSPLSKYEVLTGSEMLAFSWLEEQYADIKVGYEVFAEAVREQSFRHLVRKAQSSSRVSMVEDLLRPSKNYTPAAGDVERAEEIRGKLKLIIDNDDLTDHELVIKAMEVMTAEQLMDRQRSSLTFMRCSTSPRWSCCLRWTP